MCSISDIPIVGAVVNHISEDTVGAVYRAIRYILFYKDNVDELNSEIGRLNTTEKKIEGQVEEAINNGKTIIMEHVSKWQDDVKEIKGEVTEFLRKYEGRTSWRCFTVLRCPNPYRRFQLGRWAAKKTTMVSEFSDLEKKQLTGEISKFPPDSPISRTEYQNFRSREESYKKILEALINYKEDGFPVVGVYGFGGVGKTWMMEEASKEVKAKGIFKKVARANVGQEVDIGKIQDQLMTDLSITEKTENKTSQLKAILRNGNTFLVILDDVWSEIPFTEIGIPFGDASIKGCKILLTSRLRDACIHNNCKDPVEIKGLTEDEAWGMFTKTVGTIESVRESLAREVCHKCARLPLIIAAVGKALLNKGQDSWEDALNQLMNCKPGKIPGGITREAYACLRLSFNILDKDAYLCLLLCSLTGEDEEIQIEFLFRLATGSGLLEDWNTYTLMKDARQRVNAMVSQLKSSSLLLKGRDYDSVKLHDIIRDVARSIIHDKESEYEFLSESNRHSLRHKVDILSSRKLIYLDFKSDNVYFPDDRVCLDLHTLYLKCSNLSGVQLPDSFFESFPKLKYLLLDIESLSTMPSSIQNLDRLRSLTIHRCKVTDISHIIQLKNLEMLSFQNFCFGGLLLDLRQLRGLRMLDLLGCTEIMGIVLSGLECLEELYLPIDCNILDEETKRKTPLSSMPSKLTSLEICFEDVKSCPDDIFCKNLCSYKICVGGNMKFAKHDSIMKSVYFCNDSIGDGVKTLVERGEDVTLERVTGLQKCFSQEGGAFTDLKRLNISECTGDEYLFRIHPQPHRAGSFSKLSVLKISNSGFKYLFCTSTARYLQQLEELEIDDCEMMEEIVRNEGQINEIIYFPKLRFLCLTSLPVFKSFCGKVSLFPSLEVLWLLGVKINLEQIYLGRDYKDDSTSKLRTVSIVGSESQAAQQIIPPNWLLASRDYLEYLAMENCDFDEGDLFSLLGNSSWKNNPYGTTITFPRLWSVEVYSCRLSTLFTCSVAKALQQLQRLVVRSCGSIEEIVTDERRNDELVVEEISFPNLWDVGLSDLPNLKSFCPSANYCYKMPSLDYVTIRRCPQMLSFTRGQISTPSLDRDINRYLHPIRNKQQGTRYT